MAHFSRISKIVIDVPAESHADELAFWQAATGEQFEGFVRYPEYHGAMLRGERVGMLVQRLGDGAARVHLDIHTDDVDAERARLEKLGAHLVQEVNSWLVMRDPAGLLFCVIGEPPGSFDDSNAHRWQ